MTISLGVDLDKHVSTFSTAGKMKVSFTLLAVFQYCVVCEVDYGQREIIIRYGLEVSSWGD